MDAISIQNLVVEYRRPFKKPFRAVDDLSFSVATGEVVGCVGINGAGKTTTIKTLLGFQPKTSGNATIFGHNAGEREHHHKAITDSLASYDRSTSSTSLQLFANINSCLIAAAPGAPLMYIGICPRSDLTV